jgi:septal ring factor EnvC (AmiA/AmiB activator)
VTQPSDDVDLATAIVGLYRAPLEEFTSRRDALAKQLRADKRRDDAALVKALRKPSRMAWTLDGIVHEDPASIDRLAAAIAEAQTGADLRTALAGVKDAVRAVAAAGARVAVRAGQPLEPTALAAAVHAIIGDATAFEAFRAGRLIDVPHAGGLDLLTALTEIPAPAKTAKPTPPPVASEPVKVDPRVERAAAARAELRAAEQQLAETRAQAKSADESLGEAKEQLAAAEHALEKAHAELEARREDVERVQRRAESAAANLEDAQRVVDDARARIAEFE